MSLVHINKAVFKTVKRKHVFQGTMVYMEKGGRNAM